MSKMVVLWLFLSLVPFLVVAQTNCVLMVPDHPLTAQGLTSLWTLVGAGCNQANATFSRFVHGVILNTDNGQFSIYNPLVVTQGTQPLAAPAPVTLPANNVIILFLGSNSNFLTLGNDVGIQNGRCVTGPPGSPFGQYGFCNADAFWATYNILRNAGKIPVPAPGLAVDGQPCPLLRNFFIIDQDPSDGVQTLYLTQNNQVAQKTKKNMAAFPNAQELANDGDNRLITKFVLPAIGCKVWTAPDLADPGVNRPADALNIIQAATYSPQPWAIIPANDPMTTNNGQIDINKVNMYKTSVMEPLLGRAEEADPTHFCQNYFTIAPPRFVNLKQHLLNFKSPAPTSPNLFQFMKARAIATYQMLNCQKLTGQPDPFTNL